MIAPPKNQSHVPQRKRRTVGELVAMDKAGLLDPEKHVELIDGEVYEMAIGEDHADVVNQLNEALVAKFADRARVRVQNPVFLDEHDPPQPDFALLDLAQNYKLHHPRPPGRRISDAICSAAGAIGGSVSLSERLGYTPVIPGHSRSLRPA